MRQCGFDQPVLGRRSDGEWQASSFAQVDGMHCARLQLTSLDDEVYDPVDDHDRDVLRGRSVPRKERVPVFGDFSDEHPLGRADGARGKGDAQPAEDLEFGLVPEDLRVDEQPVHIEDGRVEPRPDGVRRNQAAS